MTQMSSYRGWAFKVVALLGVLAAPAGLFATTGESTERAHTNATRIVCITSSSGSTYYGQYLYRPRNCLLKEKGQWATAGTTLYVKHLRWTSWGPGRALARGKAHTNAGVSHVHLSLTRPRTVCGERVFTKVKVGHWSMHPDDCLAKRIDRGRRTLQVPPL